MTLKEMSDASLRSANAKGPRFKKTSRVLPWKKYRIPLFFAGIVLLMIVLFLTREKADPTMILVPEGCYTMGAVAGDPAARKPELPAHTVCLETFKLDRNEVTQQDYQKIMGINPSGFVGCQNCPVEMVTWQNAHDYCAKVDKRLPSEAEWEYAARAGTSTLFPNPSGFLPEHAWFVNNSHNSTQPVRTTPANAYGVYDMQGNVWEWTADWADIAYYSNSPKDNPVGPINGQDRIVRGGAYNSQPYNLRPSTRAWTSLNERQSYIGFRCAK